MMKKLLLLGGSAQQIVAVETAKKLGYYTVVCDFLEDNPGQNYADKFYLVSTTDKDAVLKLAREEKIDGIIAYASDPAAPTAAYVAEKLGLPGNPYEAVEILCNKDKFRAFLKANGFNTPIAEGYGNAEEAINALASGRFRFPVLIKPVDSSGSKGISKLCGAEGAESKIARAMSYSRKKRIVIEEYVENFGYQIAGDGMSLNGELVFRCFGNDHFDKNGVNPFVPIAASFPYNMPRQVHDKIHAEIQRLITLLGLRDAVYNFDIRIDSDYNVYLMEIAPRSGGNYIPQVINYITGTDMVPYAVKMAMGDTEDITYNSDTDGFYAYYAVHSGREGILREIRIAAEAEKNIIDKYIVKHKGDPVSPFVGSNSTLGVLIMKFDGMSQMLDMMDNSEKWISVVLEED